MPTYPKVGGAYKCGGSTILRSETILNTRRENTFTMRSLSLKNVVFVTLVMIVVEFAIIEAKFPFFKPQAPIVQESPPPPSAANPLLAPPPPRGPRGPAPGPQPVRPSGKFPPKKPIVTNRPKTRGYVGYTGNLIGLNYLEVSQLSLESRNVLFRGLEQLRVDVHRRHFNGLTKDLIKTIGVPKHGDISTLVLKVDKEIANMLLEATRRFQAGGKFADKGFYLQLRHRLQTLYLEGVTGITLISEIRSIDAITQNAVQSVAAAESLAEVRTISGWSVGKINSVRSKRDSSNAPVENVVLQDYKRASAVNVLHSAWKKLGDSIKRRPIETKNNQEHARNVAAPRPLRTRWMTYQK